jgi:dihydroorotate dehydrogenase/Pyruvate/2-oxoacid:ferredoxin oxidoreductase delta subunit
MADLHVELCGVNLKNPVIASSGPLCFNALGMRRCFDAGAAAAVTKTIAPVPAVNPVPHIRDIGRGMLLNTEKWADLSVEQWVQDELPSLRDASGVVIASLGHSASAVEALVRQVARLDMVKMLEVTSYYASDMAPMVQAVKRVTDVPVLIKACADWPDFSRVIDDCVDAGVDGITAGDALGPVLHIDVETARPAMGGNYGYARLSGTAIKLLWVRIVADIRRRHVGLPIVATGGITSPEDAVEMLMAGATAVAACSAPMLRGVQWFERTIAGLGRWLDKHGYASIADVRGLALPNLVEGEDHRPLSFRFVATKCNECGRCVLVCPYEARQLTGKLMSLDGQRCRSCGLCVSTCSTMALTAAPA